MTGVRLLDAAPALSAAYAASRGRVGAEVAPVISNVWPTGEAMLNLAERLVEWLARSRVFWKLAPLDPVSFASVRANEAVIAAFQARDLLELKVAIYMAAVYLPRLRPIGRAALYLSWWLSEPRPVTRLVPTATRTAGVSARTLRRAKRALSMKAMRRGDLAGDGHWEWQHSKAAK